MKTTAQYLQSLVDTKQSIKQALINKGKQPSQVFASYPELIQSIQQGGNVQLGVIVGSDQDGYTVQKLDITSEQLLDTEIQTTDKVYVFNTDRQQPDYTERNDIQQPLRITAITDGTRVILAANYVSFADIDLYYRTSSQTQWLQVPKNTQTYSSFSVSLNKGQYVEFWNKVQRFSRAQDQFFGFKFVSAATETQSVEVSGSIQSLLNYNLSCPDSCFSYLFHGTMILSAPLMPATTVGQLSYARMYMRCSKLKRAPQLPAKHISIRSYLQMFAYAAQLQEVPKVLPALQLHKQCYYAMFKGCLKLKDTPQLPARTAPNRAYYCMFYNCSSLEQAPQLPADTLGVSCYAYMFYGCSSLKRAPELPAIHLEDSCYSSMFRGCTSLLETPLLAAYDPYIRFQCYKNMFNGCSSLRKITVRFSQWKQFSKTDYDSDSGVVDTTYFTKGWVTGVTTTQDVQFIVNTSAGTIQQLYGDDFIPATWNKE